MAIDSVLEGVRTTLRPWPVPWSTVAAVAVLTAYADGFVLISAQGAVGAIQRTQSPFVHWLRTSTLLLPVHLVAVLAALALARRVLGPTLRTVREVVVAVGLVVVAATLVGFAAVVASGYDDYHLQSQQLVQTSRLHAEHAAGAGGCTGLCSELKQTRDDDEQAARLASAADLAVNAVVVAWVLALRGGRLVSPRRRQPAVR